MLAGTLRRLCRENRRAVRQECSMLFATLHLQWPIPADFRQLGRFWRKVQGLDVEGVRDLDKTNLLHIESPAAVGLLVQLSELLPECLRQPALLGLLGL